MKNSVLDIRLSFPDAEAFADYSIALMLEAQFVNSAIVVMTGRTNGILAGLYVLCLVTSWLSAFSSKRKHDIRLDYILCPYLLLCILLTYATYGSHMRGGLPKIIACLLIPYIVMSHKHNPLRTLKAIVFLSLIGLPFSSQVLARSPDGMYMEMGSAYAAIPSIIASMTLLLAHRESIGMVTALGVIANAYYALQILQYGSRGAILCMIIAAVLLLFKYDIFSQRRREGIPLLVVAFAIIMLLLMSNIESVLIMANNTALRNGYYFAFLDKSARLLSSNSIDNGRNYIYTMAIEGFISHPLLGNGVNMFEFNTGIQYPHNIILQLLYDGGMVMTAFVMSSFFYGIYNVYKYFEDGEYILFVLLFCSSIPRLMVSQDMWEVVYFWALMSFLHQVSSRARNERAYWRDSCEAHRIPV